MNIRLAANFFQSNCKSGQSINSCTGLPNASAGSGQLQHILVIFFGIAAVISVLMIIIGGIMFTTAGDSAEDSKKARETIIYAVVGLLVSLMAGSIVALVLGKL